MEEWWVGGWLILNEVPSHPGYPVMDQNPIQEGVVPVILLVTLYNWVSCDGH